MAHNNVDLQLPGSVVTIIDLGRLERELNVIDDYATQLELRQPGEQPKLPRINRSLEDLAQLNGINLLKPAERQILKTKLEDLRRNAPVVHISLVSNPPADFLTKIISWFRGEIHPQIFLQVGLQPNIAAGCVIRTANKRFDFSLRRYFSQHRQILIDKLAQGS